MLENTPTDYMPEWVKYLIATLLGGGAVKWLSVYLENRRLASKDFRETLLERIRELETVVGSLQTRIGNLRVEVAHLEAENRLLKRKFGVEETPMEPEGDAHP